MIDNIFTNNFVDTDQHYQGIFYNDISDHFPVFHVNKQNDNKNTTEHFIWRRKITQYNITNFANECQNADWDPVLETSDGQNAYTKFSSIFSKLYDKHFPLRKIKMNQNKIRIPWLTDILRNAIKKKNKLFIQQKKSGNPEHNKVYINYKKYLNKLLQKKERLHYSDLIEEHKGDLKKSWSVLRRVLNRNRFKSVTSKFKYNNDIIEDKQYIAEKFNDFFY